MKDNASLNRYYGRLISILRQNNKVEEFCSHANTTPRTLQTPSAEMLAKIKDYLIANNLKGTRRTAASIKAKKAAKAGNSIPTVVATPIRHSHPASKEHSDIESIVVNYDAICGIVSNPSLTAEQKLAEIEACISRSIKQKEIDRLEAKLLKLQKSIEEKRSQL